MKFSIIILLAPLTSSLDFQEGRTLAQAKSMLVALRPDLNTGHKTQHRARDILFRHGCYCYSMGSGNVGPRHNYHGPALDKLDELCRDLYRAQRCLKYEMESSSSSNSNSNNSVSCNLSIGYPFYKNQNTGEIICNHQTNPNWNQKPENQCRYKNCQLEKEFIEKVEALLSSTPMNRHERNIINPIYADISDNDYGKYCPAETYSGNNKGLEACCGIGIERKPYDAVNRSCCSEKVVDLGNC